MSRRYKSFDVKDPFFSVQYSAPMTDVRDGLPRSEETADEHLVERGALVISADEYAVFHGTPDELRTMLLQALMALPPSLNTYEPRSGIAYRHTS